MFESHCSTPGQGMEAVPPSPNHPSILGLLTGVLGSGQARPGLAYVGWLQCLSALCTPAPQLREQEAQALQELQPPSMGSGRKPTGTHSPLKHHCRTGGNEGLRVGSTEAQHTDWPVEIPALLAWGCLGSAGLCQSLELLKPWETQRCWAV